MTQIFENNALSIGNTPLVRLNRIGNGNILAKLENRNPAFSVKCRIGANMIAQAEKDGTLTEGMTIIEPSSGNTGIALCFVAAAKGYPVKITMPASMSLERRQVMKALGAEIITTEPAKGMKGAIEKAQEIADNNDDHILLQQFENPANPAVHVETTGPEIWEATDGQVDILVSGVGTGGTITGISRFFKEHKGAELFSVAVEPDKSPVITQALAGEEIKPAPHKIQGIGAGFIPKTLDLAMVDAVEQVSEEDSMTYAHRLMKDEGILAGISCGAAVAVADRLSQRPEYADKTIVVVLPDSGERYLSSPLFAGQFSENELVQ